MTAMDNLASGLGLMVGVPLFILASDAVEKRLVEWWQARRFARLVDERSLSLADAVALVGGGEHRVG